MTVTGGEATLFAFIAPATVLCALVLLFTRKAVHSAIAMVGVMVSLAVLYVMLQAPFLGMAQIVVYTGAIMMLFLFVLMLVGVDASDSRVETLKGQRWIGFLAGGGLAVILISVVSRAAFTPANPAGFGPAGAGLDTEGNEISNPQVLARILFSDFLFTMEMVAFLLVTAALAALVLAHRRRTRPVVTQGQMAADRMFAKRPLTPLPAPGVYARHNAMDVPALDPYGQPIPESVSRILRIRGQHLSVAQATALPQDPANPDQGAQHEGQEN